MENEICKDKTRKNDEAQFLRRVTKYQFRFDIDYKTKRKGTQGFNVGIWMSAGSLTQHTQVAWQLKIM
jgi:hypothetical protein